ncbi:MAG: hypothetical protein WAQ22_01200, partial [Candidatus Saccharimonas sp.]
MTIEEYTRQALSTLTYEHDYGDIDAQLMAQVLGLVGESGEVAEKFKKIVRDKQGKLSKETKQEIL